MKRRKFVQSILFGSPAVYIAAKLMDFKTLGTVSAIDKPVEDMKFFGIVVDEKGKQLFPKKQFKYKGKRLQIKYDEEDFRNLDKDTLLKEIHICDTDENIIWVHSFDSFVSKNDTLTITLPDSVAENICRTRNVTGIVGKSSVYTLT